MGERVAPKRGISADRPVVVENVAGSSDFVLLCGHASNTIPPELNNLGLSGDELESYIAWDPGALGVAHAMSGLMDAALIYPTVSRLVIDCNRAPDALTSFPKSARRPKSPAMPGSMRPHVRNALPAPIAPITRRLRSCWPSARRRGGGACSSPSTATRPFTRASPDPGMWASCPMPTGGWPR